MLGLQWDLTGTHINRLWAKIDLEIVSMARCIKFMLVVIKESFGMGQQHIDAIDRSVHYFCSTLCCSMLTTILPLGIGEGLLFSIGAGALNEEGFMLVLSWPLHLKASQVERWE